VVAAESFERIHRSNLVGMGVLPLELGAGARESLKLDGTETFDVVGLGRDLATRAALKLRVRRAGGAVLEVPAVCRIDTEEELEYYRHGGILPYVYRGLMAQT
jgi:aconitate hydratase